MVALQRLFFTASQLQSLLAKHLIDFGEPSDETHKAPVLVHLTARVIQRKFRNAATACLTPDFACQRPAMVQRTAGLGALAFRIATLSVVWTQVAGSEFADRGDLSGQFVALRFDLFNGIHGLSFAR